jgi:PAS domain S-box-containing protein
MDDALPAARAWREGRTVRAADPSFGWAALVLGDRRRRAPRSELAAPILHGREPLGVLVLQSPEPDAFTAADADLLTLIGRQAGIVIENARLIDAERREHAIAEAAMRMARVALSAPSLADAAGAILSALDGVVPSAGKSLAVAEDPSTGSVTGAMRVVGTSGSPPGANAIVIPLTARDRMIGILAVTADTGGRPLAAETRDTLHRLSATVALAVDAQLLAEGERRRRAREGMLATALATMDHPVFILSREHSVLYANAAALREYGWTAEELVGRGADALTSSPFPAVHEEPETDAARALASVGVELIEQVHRRRDGTQFPVAVALSPIRETGGVAVGWVLSVRNVTDERRIAEQLRQSEKLAALGELVAGVAHELNNPLAGISAFAQLMMEEDLPPDQHESVRLIKREADRAVSVIRDLLVFSRKSGPAIGPVDPNALVQLSLRLRGYALRAAGVDVQTELDPEVPVVQGDDQKLQQVLLNLLVNAEYAMRGSSAKRLVLRTSHGRDPRLGDSVTLEVSDSGTGMTAETRARIFEPFFTTKPPGIGTGLGLSVSYGIIEAHGGAIAVESELGHGTSFRITLPVHYGGTAANGRTQRSA